MEAIPPPDAMQTSLLALQQENEALKDELGRLQRQVPQDYLEYKEHREIVAAELSAGGCYFDQRIVRNNQNAKRDEIIRGVFGFKPSESSIEKRIIKKGDDESKAAALKHLLAATQKTCAFFNLPEEKIGTIYVEIGLSYRLLAEKTSDANERDKHENSAIEYLRDGLSLKLATCLCRIEAQAALGILLFERKPEESLKYLAFVRSNTCIGEFYDLPKKRQEEVVFMIASHFHKKRMETGDEEQAYNVARQLLQLMHFNQVHYGLMLTADQVACLESWRLELKNKLYYWKEREGCHKLDLNKRIYCKRQGDD